MFSQAKKLCKVAIGALRPFFDAKNYKEKNFTKMSEKNTILHNCIDVF